MLNRKVIGHPGKYSEAEPQPLEMAVPPTVAEAGVDVGRLDGRIDKAERADAVLLAGLHRRLQVVVDLVAHSRLHE